MSIQKTMEAYLEMVSEASCGKDRMKKEEKQECPKCEGEGCDHCDGKGYHEKEVKEKKLDPVNDKENDKKFKDRKDKDIDNDGDVDDSDEFLHKRRKAIDNTKDGGEKPAENDGEGEEEAPAPKDDKKKKDKNPRTSDNKAEISKIGEAFDQMWVAIEEAAGQKKGATPPEEMDSKASGSEKKWKDQHKVDKKELKDVSDAEIQEPKERTVKKENMSEFEVIRAILSGKVPNNEE